MTRRRRGGWRFILPQTGFSPPLPILVPHHALKPMKVKPFSVNSDRGLVPRIVNACQIDWAY